VNSQKIFRFFSPKDSDFFYSKRLWFSAVEYFNDPFEALPSYRMADFEIEKIREILKSPEWDNVEKFVMRIHDTDYKIEPQPLLEWKPTSQEIRDKMEIAFDAAASIAKQI
jgi:hypothetical protein